MNPESQTMLRGAKPRRVRRASLGLFLRALASTVMVTGLAVLGGEYGGRVWDSGRLERAEREATFVRDTEAAIRAWSFDALDGLNGRTFHSRATAAESEFRVELELVSAGHDDSGVRVRAVVRDNRTSEEISRIVTFRGRT